MKLLKLILFWGGGIILAILIFKSLVIGLPKSGQVLDSVTKKPLGDIFLIRNTNLITPSFHGGATKIIRTATTKTDNDGNFSFPVFVQTKFFDANLIEVLLGTSVGEHLFVNDPSRASNFNYNFGYHTVFYYSRGPYEGLLYKTESNVYNKPFNFRTAVYLAPLVADLKDCQEDEECVARNRELAESCKRIPSGPGSEPQCKNLYLISE